MEFSYDQHAAQQIAQCIHSVNILSGLGINFSISLDYNRAYLVQILHSTNHHPRLFLFNSLQAFFSLFIRVTEKENVLYSDYI